MKEGTILTQKGEFGLEDLEQINRYTRRPLTAAEVYAFPLVLCDNEIDRDQEAFTKAALETLAGLFLGKTGLFDHQHTTLHQTARIYHTEVVEHPDRVTRCHTCRKRSRSSAVVPFCVFCNSSMSLAS